MTENRLWQAICAALDLWIPPWDRSEYAPWEALRNPWVAWTTARGIYHA